MTSLFKALMLRAEFPRLLSLVLIVAMFTLAGCSDPNDDFIQGHWQRGNVHVWDDWYFDTGNFMHEFSFTLNSPYLNNTGRYQVLESQDDRMIIELFDQQLSFGVDDRQQVLIVIDREANTIHFQGKTYQRVYP